MKTNLLALLMAGLLLPACNESVKRTEDGTADALPDVEDEDMSLDMPADAEPDVVEDVTVDPGDDVTTDPVEDPTVDTIGMPCTSDEDCDMGTFCDGPEYCHPAGDCRRAPAPDCGDDDDCTIDTCVEETDSCAHELIDGDSDGYAPESCGGPDCDDADVAINPGATDVCGDGIDQDCSGEDASSGACACPLTATVGSTITGRTSGTSSATDGSCATGSGAPELVYELVLGSDGGVSFDLSAPGWYGIVYIRQATCDGTELGCFLDTDPALGLSLTAGTYYIIVDGRSSTEDGDFTLVISSWTPPTPVTGNDDCGTAYTLTADGSYGGNNSTFSDDAQPAGCAGTSVGRGGQDAWFTFTITGGARTVTFDTIGSRYDTVLYIRQGSCTGSEIACNDDLGGGSTASRISRSFSAGTYYVILDDFYDTTGDYILNVSGL